MLHDDIWNKCLDIIKKSVNDEGFQTWFVPIHPLKFEDNTLTIQIPNQFFYEWLEEHYLSVLKNAIIQTVGVDGNLEYSLSKDVVEEKKESRQLNQGETFHVHELNPKYTLENFIEGDCNNLAKSAAKSIISKYRNNPFNPLMIYGDVGLGKTHLVQAIGNGILKKENAKVVYVQTNDFIAQFVDCIKNNEISKFTKFYFNADVLIIDDIQFLKNKTKTQEILFNIFNKLHQEGKQIILTSDNVPGNNQGIQERLVSRFKWGLTVCLTPPDLETKIAIIKSKADLLNIDIDYKTIEKILDSAVYNIRELEGMFLSLSIEAENKKNDKKETTEDEKVKEATSQSNETLKDITIDRILKAVSKQLNILPEDIIGGCRRKDIVFARQVVMYLSKKLTNESLCNIGQKIGNRDHSTVIHAIRAIDDKYKNDADSLIKKITI